MSEAIERCLQDVGGDRHHLQPYELKRRWKDGTTHVVMTAPVLVERLLALVPSPRRHLVTYHGVLGPAAGLRGRVVPRWEDGGDGVAPEAVAEEEGEGGAIAALRRRRGTVPHAPGKRRRGGVRRYAWAELLRRVYEIDVLLCACGGRRRVLAAIHYPDSIRRVLAAMGLPCDVPELAPASDLGIFVADAPAAQRNDRIFAILTEKRSIP